MTPTFPHPLWPEMGYAVRTVLAGGRASALQSGKIAGPGS